MSFIWLFVMFSFILGLVMGVYFKGCYDAQFRNVPEGNRRGRRRKKVVTCTEEEVLGWPDGIF